MRITVSVIKADVGSVGGHTKPSGRMLECVRSEVSKAIGQSLLVDGFVSHTGNDIAIIMSHRRGKGHPDIHGFAWNAFLNATRIARDYGLYGAGQDLLVDAPSGNLRGAGPAVAEIEFEHTLAGHRPAESFLVLAADKCGPGAWDKPAGTIRITAGDHATETILWPKLAKFLPSYPDIKVEITWTTA